MKKISLTQGQFAIVDEEDFPVLNCFKWCARKQQTEPGYVAMRGYQIRKGKIQCVLMHRQILDAPKGKQVDHINHNTLDNRRKNLRIVTNRENCINKGISKVNTSGFKGVSFKKEHKKWQASIKNHQKQTHIGYFSSPEKAATAYNVVAKNLFGKFAVLNDV